ncbi:DUF6531 domain-containing protein [Curtobacterium sp. VKM Ac-2922]|uniref:DUF6531 domain-containing protein n=1 Tax=Curtobacterium sp. VKM Ac-2922 TaxID=2929475 RepID=UPI001FB413A6|nr:DUF6531 domain-containing protein [Curtobacterium sp. VKM Ac-2922]MCJ1714542.1 DUF6531 domain-containing protein [Curtobacterium sp. VKM Ac-2922]
MAQIHANTDDIAFDDATAAALKTALTTSADAITSQSGSRQSYVSTASQEFRGRFADLFTQNAATAKNDAQSIADAMTAVAGWVQQMRDAATKERARRKTAREWQEREDGRNGLQDWANDTFHYDPMPDVKNEKAPSFPSPDVRAGTRQTPNPGTGGGGGGGTSSARPTDLRSFATGSSTLNRELDGKPAALRGKLADFAAQCSWGHIDAGGLVTAFEQWLAANDQDVTWATTIAAAFAAAGGDGAVSSVADSALAAALAAAGVSQSRQDIEFDPPTAYGAQPTTGFSMDPVNTGTGNFLEPELDLAFTGASASLRVTRMYNSLDDHVGLFGPGWSSVLETRLVLDDEGATFVGGDGRQIRFPRAADGWARGVGENRWLAAEGDQLVVRDNAGERIAFTPSGLWTGQRGGTGTGVQVVRDADDTIVRLVHEHGRSVDVDHVDGRVAVLRASDGRRVEYGYDDRGRLTTVTDPVGTRTYGWNDDDLITTVTSAAGVVEVDNTYDDRRRVVEQVSPHGRRVRFAYLPGRVTVVSDQDGTRSNSYIADTKGRLVGVVDSDDHRQSMSYDPHGNLVSVTERDGSVTVHAYDDRGRKVRTVTPAGADITYGYDDHDRPVTVVTEGGAVVTYEYSGDDHDPSVVVDPVGGRTELTWQGGVLTRVVDPTGVSATLEHDAFGELVAMTNAVGDTLRIERDAAGRPVVATSPSGARTEYRYDAAGQLVARQDPDGAVWHFEHTVGGRISAVVDPLGARTIFDHGADGELRTTTDPLGRTTTQTYDDQANLTRIELPGGADWTFVHDALSRLQAVTDPTGATWQREYDVNGGLSAVVDPTGVRQEFTEDPRTGVTTLRDAFSAATVRFDAYGRPVETTSDEAGSELVVYDAAGRPVELVDGEGGLTRLERDLAGRVTAVTTPSGARSTYEYDACGRPFAATDATGARTTLTYDADSRVVARTLPTGEVERVTYDLVGRVVAQTSPGAGTARFRYDLAGRLVSSHDVRFGQRRFRYDVAGQLTQVVNGLGGVTSFSYDDRGRLTTITDAAGGVTRHEYDDADRVVAVTDPLGRRTTATYDAAGRQLSQTDPERHTTTWTYDAAGREHRVLVDGTLQSEVHRNPRERTVVVTDHTRGAGLAVEHELQYDRRGLLVRRTRAGSALRWEYDADGRRTARIDPNGTRTTYRHDAAGHVVGVERDGLGTGTFAYDASGRIVQAATGDVVQSWSYRAGSLVAHTATTPDGVSTTTIDRDADSRITAVEASSGRVAYEYDAAGQLVRAGASTWQYDDGGRLVRQVVDGVETTLEYDVAGQLVASVRDGARTEYLHDGLGRRVRRTAADGSTTEYGWSALGSLSAIVDRDDAYTETGRLDVWADALGELAEVGGVATWFDSASSVPSLVDIGGTSLLDLPGGLLAIGDAWTQPGWRTARATDAADPWAVLAAANDLALPAGVALTGSGGLSIGGLEWLGARVYDPAARGFLSVDPLAPVVGAAWAGNPYSYAGNDPLQALDPLGLRPATDKDMQAYRDAHQGMFGDLRDWADEHAEILSDIGIGVGIGLAVIAMFTPLAPIAAVALAAGSGAALAGGISIRQNMKDGKVEWGKVGRDTAIGGISGLVGGAVAARLGQLAPAIVSKAAPIVARWSSSAARWVATKAIGGTGRAAVAGSAANGTSSGLSYAWNPKIPDKTIGGLAAATGTGVAIGAGSSVASTFMSPLAGKLPGVAGSGTAVDTTKIVIDHALGGVQAVANDAFGPRDPESAPDPWGSFQNGLFTGAKGPRVPMHGTADQ